MLPDSFDLAFVTLLEWDWVEDFDQVIAGDADDEPLTERRIRITELALQ